jgi:hypothetical protein
LVALAGSAGSDDVVTVYVFTLITLVNTKGDNMTDKVELIKQLPGYLAHEHDGQRWFVEFMPPPWLDSEGAVINDDFFDVDYPRLNDYRIKLIEQRK